MAVLNEREAEEFYGIVHRRYPWIGENSYKVLLETARKEFLAIRDDETGGISTSRIMAGSGNVSGAIAHLREHLDSDPGDADAWMELGQILCRSGDTEAGYRAINRARKLYRPADVRPPVLPAEDRAMRSVPP